MILTSGGRFAGYGFYVLKGKPVFLWNLVDLKRIRGKAPSRSRPAGTCSSSTSSTTASGMGTLAFNNMSGLGAAAPARSRSTARPSPPSDAPHAADHPAVGRELDVGSDTLARRVTTATTSVPFALNGKLNKVTLKIDRPQLSPDGHREAEAAQRNNKVSE